MFWRICHSHVGNADDRPRSGATHLSVPSPHLAVQARARGTRSPDRPVRHRSEHGGRPAVPGVLALSVKVQPVGLRPAHRTVPGTAHRSNDRCSRVPVGHTVAVHRGDQDRKDRWMQTSRSPIVRMRLGASFAALMLAATVVAPTSVGAADPAVEGVSPSSLAFGNVVVGNTTATQEVTVTNTAATGSASLQIGTLSVSGATSANFALSADSCSGATIAPGAACTVDVSFMPLSRGLRSASLQIPDEAAGSFQVVAMTGTGVAPVVSVTPSSLDFGAVDVGASAAVRRVTVSNAGTDLGCSPSTMSRSAAESMATSSSRPARARSPRTSTSGATRVHLMWRSPRRSPGRVRRRSSSRRTTL
jgi:hypothetical protein